MLTLLPGPAPARLLLVEADGDVSAALVRGIRRAGWLVAHAATAAAALKLRAEFAPDVVLLSLNLPDMDGGALAALFAEQGGCGVVAMSGRGDAAGQAVLARGAHDFITKPMGIRDVVARLDAAVQRLAQGAAPDTMSGNALDLYLPDAEHSAIGTGRGLHADQHPRQQPECFMNRPASAGRRTLAGRAGTA